jgi:hypothetical protein
VDLVAATVGPWVSKFLRLAVRTLDGDIYERAFGHDYPTGSLQL